MMDQKTNQLSLIEDKDASEEAVREYVKQLEHNTEWWKEQCMIYKTQKEIARSKVSFLEMKVMQLQEVIRQLQNAGH